MVNESAAVTSTQTFLAPITCLGTRLETRCHYETNRAWAKQSPLEMVQPTRLLFCKLLAITFRVDSVLMVHVSTRQSLYQ